MRGSDHMPTWPSIAVDNHNLRAVAFDLWKRSQRISVLVTDCIGKRVQSLEDVSPQASVPREWMEFAFTVQDDAQTKTKFALSDANDFWLHIAYQPVLVLEGRLRAGRALEFAHLVEKTLRLVQRGASAAEIQSLWKENYDA